jgi:phosphatidylserine/phosphatidylglycerophosphate/cardiolipin synthase-like enzyme
MQPDSRVQLLRGLQGPLLVLLPALSFGCGASTQVWFTPSEEVKNVLDAEFSAAASHIHVAIYTFTEADIASSLMDAARRVEVKVCADWNQTDNPQVGQKDILRDLVDAGVQVRKSDGGGGGIMHHKFAVIDDRQVFTGSFNYTRSAVLLNSENLVLIRDPGTAADYEAVFQELWSGCVELDAERPGDPDPTGDDTGETS